jgi:hypothetical protein
MSGCDIQSSRHQVELVCTDTCASALRKPIIWYQRLVCHRQDDRARRIIPHRSESHCNRHHRTAGNSHNASLSAPD